MTTTQTKGQQYTTGTVHYAVEVKHVYTGALVLKPACRRAARLPGANHYLGKVDDSVEVTCKRCLAGQ